MRQISFIILIFNKFQSARNTLLFTIVFIKIKIIKNITKKSSKMHHPGLEPGSTDWKSVIIPLDQ